MLKKYSVLDTVSDPWFALGFITGVLAGYWFINSIK